MFEIALDTGGTFTDAALIDEDQRITTTKAPTTVADPSVGMMECIRLLAEERGMTEAQLLANTAAIVAGSTVATNAAVERKGARCCLIHTRGFRDVLELSARIPRADPYNLRVNPPEYLIPRYLRFGVEERLQYDGQVITPLNEDEVRAAMGEAKKHDVVVPVVCFLHSYINPEHEERAAEIIRSEFPMVVTSSGILRKRMEGHRFHTAVLAGYVKPVVANFVGKLASRLQENGFGGSLLFVTCAGGVAAAQVMLENPVLMLGSGPAAGPLFAVLLGEACGFDNIISLDMGGTSVDLAIMPDRRITTTTESIVAGHRNATESVDVSSIGTGGGTIAWINRRGVLQVGPESAGAEPGPACYGKGGRRPTVTDADVVLGYIPADYFLGGRVRLDVDLAREAIQREVAGPLGIDVVEAAHAIASLAEEHIEKELYLSCIKRGVDSREFVLVVGGGAGAVHATRAAGSVVKQVYVPKHAGVFCPIGTLAADYKYVLKRFYNRSGEEIVSSELELSFQGLEEEGAAVLKRQGIPDSDVRLVRGADMRYFGQMTEIESVLPETRPGERFDGDLAQALARGFHERHEAIFGHSNRSLPVTIETLKLYAIGKRRPLNLTEADPGGPDSSRALKRTRPVYFKECGGFVETRCYDGDLLRPENLVAGPAIVEERQTTVVVPPGYTLVVDRYRNYLLSR